MDSKRLHDELFNLVYFVKIRLHVSTQHPPCKQVFNLKEVIVQRKSRTLNAVSAFHRPAQVIGPHKQSYYFSIHSILFQLLPHLDMET